IENAAIADGRSKDTSNVTVKKSSVYEKAGMAQRSDRDAPFWPQIGPVCFLVLIFFLNFTARIILSPLLPTIEKELGVTHGQAGFFFFLISGGYLVGLLSSGLLASRFTHKTAIISSSVGVGVALLFVSLAIWLWAIRIGLVAVGFSAGLYIPSAIATITSIVKQQHWGKAIAVHELAPNVAFFVAPFLAELFLRRANWRIALGSLGAAAIVASFVFGRYGRAGEFPGQSPASSAVAMLIRRPAFWLMVVLFGLGVSSTIGIYAMLPLYLVTERHIDQSWANTLVALSRSYGPLLGLLGGWASDHLGPKQTIMISLTFTGVATSLLGLQSRDGIGMIVLFQPLLAVWFFPAAFAAIALITEPGARNLAVAFTVPFGFVIGGGAIPTFNRRHGRRRLVCRRLCDYWNSHFMRRATGGIAVVTGT
ncbi:MAG: MFS transporter, partial [Candidatus Binatia bacterium]